MVYMSYVGIYHYASIHTYTHFKFFMHVYTHVLNNYTTPHLNILDQTILKEVSSHLIDKVKAVTDVY